MSKAINLMGEYGEHIVPIMVTVDPWRDSVEHLAGYVADFHPRLVGLVGTPQQIDNITRDFRVYTSKGPEETEGDYLMDHSIFMYLMDREGKMLDYFGVAMEAEDIAESLRSHLIIAGLAPESGIIGRFKWWFKSFSKDDKPQNL